jgi:K+-transporting ATPase A subunit
VDPADSTARGDDPAVDPAEPVFCLDHGRTLSGAEVLRLVRSASEQRTAGLEAVHHLVLGVTAILFTFGFIVLCLQPIAPFNPLGRGMLSPSTIFNTVISFMTNTNLQHYSGDQNFSNFSQIFFILPNMFLSASIGICALSAIIRAFRGEATVGNFFVDMWRSALRWTPIVRQLEPSSKV